MVQTAGLYDANYHSQNTIKIPPREKSLNFYLKRALKTNVDVAVGVIEIAKSHSLDFFLFLL